MSKITFRADDELIEELEEFDVSKSEVMRRALREFLESSPKTDVNAAIASDSGTGTPDPGGDSFDDLFAERVDALIEERLDRRIAARNRAQDINVNVTLDGDPVETSDAEGEVRKTGAPETSDAPEEARTTCGQCGEEVAGEHVYCPNCGEKATRRVFCDCGDELRSDWAFCPSCGRRTPAADVLDSP